MNKKKVKYRFSDRDLYEDMLNEDIHNNAKVCLTTYKNNYSLLSGQVLIFKVSIEDVAIYNDSHRSFHMLSYFLVAIGLFIQLVYWLFIKIEKY